MGKYPKARVVPFSSVVGSSVTLHDPETERVIGQLAILNVGGDTPDDWKARSIAFADDTAKRINCHDDLVAALEKSQLALRVHGVRVRQVDAALAKAKGAPLAPHADPTAHAGTAPGPVNCNTVLRLQHPSVPRPRSCMRCGLGPCPFFDNDGNSLRQGGAS